MPYFWPTHSLLLDPNVIVYYTISIGSLLLNSTISNQFPASLAIALQSAVCAYTLAYASRDKSPRVLNSDILWVALAYTGMMVTSLASQSYISLVPFLLIRRLHGIIGTKSYNLVAASVITVLFVCLSYESLPMLGYSLVSLGTGFSYLYLTLTKEAGRSKSGVSDSIMLQVYATTSVLAFLISILQGELMNTLVSGIPSFMLLVYLVVFSFQPLIVNALIKRLSKNKNTLSFAHRWKLHVLIPVLYVIEQSFTTFKTVALSAALVAFWYKDRVKLPRKESMDQDKP